MYCNTSQETLAPLLPVATSAQVETFSEAALKRIKDRRDAEIRTGERNYNEIVAYIEESFIRHYTKREDQAILMNWKTKLLELLRLPLPYDPMYNFQWSNSNVIRDSLYELGRRLRDHVRTSNYFHVSSHMSLKSSVLPEMASHCLQSGWFILSGKVLQGNEQEIHRKLLSFIPHSKRSPFSSQACRCC